MERKLTARQNEIVEAALRLTAEGGLGNLTIRNLGEALGISEPAIYRHFRNKSEIVRSTIERFDRAVSVGKSFGDWKPLRTLCGTGSNRPWNSPRWHG